MNTTARKLAGGNQFPLYVFSCSHTNLITILLCGTVLIAQAGGVQQAQQQKRRTRTHASPTIENVPSMQQTREMENQLALLSTSLSSFYRSTGTISRNVHLLPSRYESDATMRATKIA
jgi:hypothetical protein